MSGSLGKRVSKRIGGMECGQQGFEMEMKKGMQAGNDVIRMHCDGGAMWMDDVVNLARDRCMNK